MMLKAMRRRLPSIYLDQVIVVGTPLALLLLWAALGSPEARFFIGLFVLLSVLAVLRWLAAESWHSVVRRVRKRDA